MEPEVQDGFSYLKQTFEKLKKQIEAAIKNDDAILECFVLAGLFDNQKEGLKSYYPVDSNTEIFEEIKKIEADAKNEYQKLFRVYDRLSTKEMVDLIYSGLKTLTADYVKKMEFFGDLKEDELIKLLEARDKIKILFDELEVWTNRFEREERVKLESEDPLLLEVKKADQKLKDELVVKADTHQMIYHEAKKRLIKKPDGSYRFDFWWWHAGE